MVLFKARHRRRFSISLWRGLRIIGSISTLLLLLGLGLQWLVPEQLAQWHSESRLTEILEQPVTLEGGALRMFPLPHVAAERIELGDANARLLSGQSARLYIDPIGLLQGRPFRRVQIERGSLGLDALLASPDIIERLAAAGFSNLEIERLGADATSEEAAALSVSGLPGERWLAQLQRGEQTLSIRGKRTGHWSTLEAEAMAWRLPAAQALELSSLSALARWSEQALEVEQFNARLGGGQLHITLRAEQQRLWEIKGSATLQGVPVEALLQYLGLPLLQGRIDGSLLINGSAQHLDQLASAARFSGQAALVDGRLNGIDLQTPAERLSVGEFAAKDTAFSLLQLAISLDADGWLGEISALESSELTASGHIRIEPGEQLSGAMDVLLNETGAAQTPILVLGGVSAPRTRVAPEALLAADIGRAVLGEEQGAAGIHASGALERLSDWWNAPDDKTQATAPEPADSDPQTPWILDYE